jgi:hypothetical protein
MGFTPKTAATQPVLTHSPPWMSARCSGAGSPPEAVQAANSGGDLIRRLWAPLAAGRGMSAVADWGSVARDARRHSHRRGVGIGISIVPRQGYCYQVDRR